MTNDLLLFLAPAHGGVAGWLQVSGGAVLARGNGLHDLPGGRHRVAAVVPGEEVSLHWIDLPAGLAPAQAQAAARLLAAEASAQPVGDMHVAVGREGAPGALRPVALVSAERMEGWIAALRAVALEPDLIVPDLALLPEPEAGFLRFERPGIALYRGHQAGFALEPDTAALIVGEAPVAEIAPAEFEAALPAGIAQPLVDLRQGPFARRREWRMQGARLRRLGFLAAALALATLALQIVQIVAYTVAADEAEEDTRRIAAQALSRSPGSAGASDLNRRLAELRGGGVGFTAVAAAVFAAVKATPNAELSAFTFGTDGTLRLTARGDTPATLAGLAQRIEAGGFKVDRMAPASAEGRQVQDMVVRPQ